MILGKTVDRSRRTEHDGVERAEAGLTDRPQGDLMSWLCVLGASVISVASVVLTEVVGLVRARRSCAAGALLAACLVLGACGGVPRAPEVGFAGVEWLGVGEQRGEQRFELRLALRNPNHGELRLDAFNADLALDGVALARGQATAPVVLPPEGSAELVLDCVGRLDKALALWAQARLAGRDIVPYRLTGNVTVAGYGVLPLERKGEVSLKDLGRWRKGVRSDDRPL